MSAKIWIRNGSVVNPQSGELQIQDIWVEDGIISRIGLPTQHQAEVDRAKADGWKVIDAQGLLVSAGFIDLHVHLREPGFEHKETIATGTQSAAKGGYTTIACMPNTRPVIDTPETVKFIYDKTAAEGSARVLPYGCITKSQLGRELTDFTALQEAGVIAYTDDGVGVQSAGMMKKAMEAAKAHGLPVVAHCEDESLLIHGAAVTDGEFAKKHGLPGICNESESIHVGRDIQLAEATGAHYHVCHISTTQSVRLVRDAKARGVRVSTEVCPHHLLLCDEDIPGPDDANWKMNPPLRSPQDRDAVIQGWVDGTIDVIVTDHAPHVAEEKARGLALAPFGIVGLETAFPLLYTHFVRNGRVTLDFLLKAMTEKPADLFGLAGGRIRVGAPADITLIDLENERAVDPNTFASKSKNTPFTGWKLYGWPVLTMLAGQVVYAEVNGAPVAAATE